MVKRYKIQKDVRVMVWPKVVDNGHGGVNNLWTGTTTPHILTYDEIDVIERPCSRLEYGSSMYYVFNLPLNDKGYLKLAALKSDVEVIE